MGASPTKAMLFEGLKVEVIDLKDRKRLGYKGQRTDGNKLAKDQRKQKFQK